MKLGEFVVVVILSIQWGKVESKNMDNWKNKGEKSCCRNQKKSYYDTKNNAPKMYDWD